MYCVCLTLGAFTFHEWVCKRKKKRNTNMSNKMGDITNSAQANPNTTWSAFSSYCVCVCVFGLWIMFNACYVVFSISFAQANVVDKLTRFVLLFIPKRQTSKSLVKLCTKQKHRKYRPNGIGRNHAIARKIISQVYLDMVFGVWV